ncbi:TIGR02996 domain-containing protein [Fimbriiglobus ruber]|uniref:TIGR02996 domain-containing protein n=1 Tax=Fimbriiglobus ruber TaxID=1908690 RepID=A0A225DN50_9BACT|nr:TIGR02996 domain-containing protein [Fimbriiglobus ruber]OWK38649.1 hypothetical protein FRUB_07769 [Fimbriiglobus ruber]
MTDENGFLNRLAAFPADNTTRLVYADWLDEQNDPACAAKAAFLRVTCQFATTEDGEQKKQLEKKLQTLAANLPAEWLAVVSYLAVENCAGKRAQPRRMTFVFDFICDKRWEDLQPTGNNNVRFCEGCQQNVYYSKTIAAARNHANRGRCVAVDCRVERKPHDLSEVRLMTVGRLIRPNPGE